ncbi:hypothetical protein BC835DRAFT_1423340 [Cytidiella melzeri]|nr:hypothetical protein BC835DRAFT_1423340 [Cytidiella melzeri]
MLPRSRTMRDAVLVLVGALSMHIATSFLGTFRPETFSGEAVLSTEGTRHSEHHDENRDKYVPSKQYALADNAGVDLAHDFPETYMDAHAPGWTVFRNLYMANGTLFVVSSHPASAFPDIQYITSTGLAAENTPENIAARMPTNQDMSFITPAQARRRWGPTRAQAKLPTARNRAYSIKGNTIIFNDPDQFLNHYYHFCAELWLGAWAMWHGVHNVQVPASSANEITAPPIDRIIFPNTDLQGWRDRPGFNPYFLRAVFPSTTVEVDMDWDDRIAATSDAGDHARVWHFDKVLLTDRSAAFRGSICGAQVHRTAAEAFYAMKQINRLGKWWWEPVRRGILTFAGVDQHTQEIGTRVEKADREKVNPYAIAVVEDDKDAKFPREPIVITYMDRQGVRRHLIEEDHDNLVRELQVFCDANGYELNIMRGETLTKEAQLAIIARTTILLGVHGNGLTHLIMMSPTPISTVIELFFPGGFAHDYEWTARALGHKHFAVWNDTYHTHPTLPWVAYPEGFQGTQIPVYAPTVIDIIKDRIAGKLR